MNATTSLDDIATFVADESHYPAAKGFRDPGSPGWIFFDDEDEMSPDAKAFRDDLVNFEEWHAARNHWDENAPEPRILAHLERMEALSRANWLIGFYKRQPRNNDHWRRLVAPLAQHVEDPVIGTTCITILKAMREILPFAPGPVNGTTFVNPDGSKHRTAGESPGTAKAAFVKRHNIEDELVTVERVQKEGERHSRYVVGVRRASDQTASNYYDPNPAWRDFEGGSYAPRACSLFRVPTPSMVMPEGSHRLTVREFEQAIIAGAETFDDEFDAMLNGIQMDNVTDTRASTIEQGYGKDVRDMAEFTEQESYLFHLLRAFGHEAACELLLGRDQSPGLLHDHFFSNVREGLTPEQLLESENAVMEMLEQVLNDDSWTTRKAFRRVVGPEGESIGEVYDEDVPPVNREPMFSYVHAALLTRPEGDVRELGARERIAILNKPHVNEYWALNPDLLLPSEESPAYLKWKD